MFATEGDVEGLGELKKSEFSRDPDSRSSLSRSSSSVSSFKVLMVLYTRDSALRLMLLSFKNGGLNIYMKLPWFIK